MANRFPVTVDASGVPVLKELPSGDNLDLTGSGVVGAGTVALTNLTVGGSQGSDGQLLTSTGSGIAWEDAAGGGRWTQIATTTIGSSEVFSIEFTSLGSYDEYEVRFQGIYGGTDSKNIGITFDYGSGYTTGDYAYICDQVAAGSGAASYEIFSNQNGLPEISCDQFNKKFTGTDGSNDAWQSAGFGYVHWTNSGSRFESAYYGTNGNVNYGQTRKLVSGINKTNHRTAPTKVKFQIVNPAGSGNSVTTTANRGMIGGKFTLFGLTLA